MATNKSELVREWIQFLKSNQIALGSDPKTGLLKYNRKPKVQELIKFLKVRSDFDEDDIRKAIRTVMSKGGKSDAEQLQLPGKTSKDVSTWQHDEMTPGEAPDASGTKVPLPPQAKPKKYSTDDAEDATYSDSSAKKEPPRELGFKKPRYKYKGPGKMDRLSEDFRDNQGMELDEKDIEAIFGILLQPKAKTAEPEPAEPDEEEIIAKKREYMRKLKQMIREVMNPAQRKALWRALGEESLSEAVINRADIEEIFKDAAYLRTKPSGLGKIFKGLRKDKIDVEDLRQAWINGLEDDGSDGESDDTNDIKRILLKFGYDEKEINKVFAQVFNSTGDEDSSFDDSSLTSSASNAVQKVANIAKENGISKQLRAFLEQEFPEDIGLGKKATYEDIKHIFTAMVNEERTARTHLIKQQEQKQLGRTKK